VQRGEHDIENEIIFTNQRGYVFHDSRGFEAGDRRELEIVQEFVRRRSLERKLNERLHAIWFALAPFDISNCKSTTFAFQALRADGQCSAVARFKTCLRYMPR